MENPEKKKPFEINTNKLNKLPFYPRLPLWSPVISFDGEENLGFP